MNTQVGSDSRPIAVRTRSNTSTGISGATASDFCNRRCTLEGPSPLSPSSSNSSNPLSFETEFPYHSPGEDQGMAHDYGWRSVSKFNKKYSTSTVYIHI